MVKRTFKSILEPGNSVLNPIFNTQSLEETFGLHWKNLYRYKRILLVSEAGTGKTYECERQVKDLTKKGSVAFKLNLSVLAEGRTITGLLEADEIKNFNSWLSSSSETATFFLDALDELTLTQSDLKTALLEFRNLIKNELARVQVIITTRPIEANLQTLKAILSVPKFYSPKQFAYVAMREGTTEQIESASDYSEDDWIMVEFEPLTFDQIKKVALKEGVTDVEKLMGALRDSGLHEFLSRPLDVIYVASYWKNHQSISNRRELIGNIVETRLSETNQQRRESASLSLTKAVEGAAKLALAMLLMGRYTISYNGISNPSVTRQSTDTGQSINPHVVLIDWNPKEINALLQRPLFEFAATNRVRIHHRAVTEYLAARQLSFLRQNKMSIYQLKKHLLYRVDEAYKVPEPKKGIAAWLATSETIIFQNLRDYEPEILISKGDPDSLSLDQRVEVLWSYNKLFGYSDNTGIYLSNYEASRFASKELGATITKIWNKSPTNLNVRLTLLHLIKSASISSCSGIAYRTAMDPGAECFERIVALEALIAIKDKKLAEFVDKLIISRGTWDKELTIRAIRLLAPDIMSGDQLFQAMTWIVNDTQFESKYYILKKTILSSNLDIESLEKIRVLVEGLARKSFCWRKKDRRFSNDVPLLTSILTAICVKGIRFSTSDEWLRTAIICIHLCDPKINDVELNKSLLALLRKLPTESYERLRKMDMDFVCDHSQTSRLYVMRDEIFFRQETLQFDTKRDLSWLKLGLKSFKNFSIQRRLLVDSVNVFVTQGKFQKEELAELSYLVSDEPHLVKKIRRLKKSPASSSESIKNDYNFTESGRDDEYSEAFASWETFFTEITDNLQGAFSTSKSPNTALNLWRVMVQGTGGTELTCWNRRLIEEYFDVSTADMLREYLSKFWRKQQIKLPSQRPEYERQSFSKEWLIGVAGIYAEAEDEKWVEKLSSEEVRLAVRYALVGYNTLPIWLTDIALHQKYSQIILQEMGVELNFDLGNTCSHSYLLQEIGYASSEVARLFIPMLIYWLKALKENGISEVGKDSSGGIVQQVTNIILIHGDDEQKVELGGIAIDFLDRQTSSDLEMCFLSVIFNVAPDQGLRILKLKLHNSYVSTYSPAVCYLGNLFGDRLNPVDFENKSYTPEIMLSLLFLVYEHVIESDDVKRSGVYSPDCRDDAQVARSMILLGFLRKKGIDAFAQKQEVADHPLFERHRDYIRKTAETELLAELNSFVEDEKKVRQFFEDYELPPQTNEQMYHLLVDRINVLREEMKSDHSPRSVWQYLDSEKLIRTALARELHQMGSSMYSVSQEERTGDEKRTDIRISINESGIVGVIELKRAENWTLKELKNAILDQLVAKYMKPVNRRAGLLLLTLSTKLKSSVMARLQKESPDIKNDGEMLVQLLEQEIVKVKNSTNDELYIGVQLLDLREPTTIERGNF